MHWYDCIDIRVTDDDGQVLYDGPKFLRCQYTECAEIATQGWLEEHDGHCYCGGRKFRPALLLTTEEKRAFMNGKYSLNAWETMMVGNDDI